jgi:hypothetical protein
MGQPILFCQEKSASYSTFSKFSFENSAAKIKILKSKFRKRDDVYHFDTHPLKDAKFSQMRVFDTLSTQLATSSEGLSDRK